MRVEQQNNILDMVMTNGVNTDNSGTILTQEKSGVTQSKETGSLSVCMKDATYLKPEKEEKESVADDAEKNAQMDALDRKNQMAVLSNTTTAEDYEKMQEEGFSMDSTDTHTIVTVTDKIKMELAKAGKDISCFGDDIDYAQLEAMVGNEALAAQMKQVLAEADLPATEENIENSLEALEQSSSLSSLSDGAVKYMVDNQLPPTIENIYKAEYSGSENFQSKSGEEVDISGFSEQVEKVITDAGLEVNEQTLADSKWMLANEIPLTPENLGYVETLKTAEFPADEAFVMQQMVTAIAEGQRPQESMLIKGYSLSDRAENAQNVITEATAEDVAYLVNHDMELTIEHLQEAAQNRGEGEYTQKEYEMLKAQRQLEEIRLIMTTEANYALLKKGISIETEPLVQLVENLKEQEQQYYANLLSAQGAEDTEENIKLFAETSEKVQEMQTVPAYVLGMPNTDVTTINQVYEAGTALKQSMEKASESYETLMTAPRADLGDSIGKAFQNVDAILTDLDMELTSENKRAVRILAYNQLEITEDSILKMKAADEEVQRVFKNLTPAVVTKMIKEGINPLNMDFKTLNSKAEEIKQTVGKSDDERFSEYLWKLEKNNEISQEERKTYIGVYRLINQVEKTDGAAIGALVNQGTDLTLGNLLTAVRSSKKNNKMDIKVDDKAGESTGKGYQNSITEQIESAYQESGANDKQEESKNQTAEQESENQDVVISYQTNCIKDAAEILSPEKLQNFIKQGLEWENMTPEQFAKALEQMGETEDDLTREYLKEQLNTLQNCAAASEEIYQILEQFDLPNTVMNVMAVNAMMTDRNRLFKQIFKEQEDSDKVTTEDIEKIKEDLLEDYAEAAAEPEALAEVQETLGKIAENVMKTMIDSEQVTSIDLKEMRLMQAKLSVNSLMAKKEQYSVPVLVGDKVTNVSLKIVRGVETKGIVDIMLESEIKGKIAATFQAKEEGISGLVVSDNQQTCEELEKHKAELTSALQGNDKENINLNFVTMKDLDLNHFSGVKEASAVKELTNLTGDKNDSLEQGIISEKDVNAEVEKESSEYKVQTARLYHIAEAFIKNIKMMEA